ncbi:MAG: FIST C-terminal domain-containing protein [Bacteroidales bacterium]|jgi:hypothetical protein|nr:FIST C-terminal domain-containing protein [Bacteroidales bacterium]
MSYQTAYSDRADVRSAVGEIKTNLSNIVDPSLIVYFVSPVYPAAEASRLMAEAFPSAQTVGCTTAGEMVAGKMLTKSIVAMACGKNSFRSIKAEALENIREDKQTVVKAFKNIEDYFHMPVSSMSPSRYLGMVLIDGQSKCEEYINDQIGNQTNVTFVGGSAATDNPNGETYIFVNGKTYTDAAVLVLLEPSNGFAFLKTQSLSLTDKKLTPTRVDESNRIVYEFNNKPAAQAYAQALNISADELPKHYTTNPLALVFDSKNYFVRDPHSILENGAMDFFCSVKEGMELTVLQAQDIVANTRKDLEQAWLNNRDPKAVIEFNCMSRMIELGEKNQKQEYAALFKSVPTIAFGTFGESYIGHMNQTSTMLFLK